jgi:hypothetical protein
MGAHIGSKSPLKLSSPASGSREPARAASSTWVARCAMLSKPLPLQAIASAAAARTGSHEFGSK